MKSELEFCCLASGSTGNCYLIGYQDEYVMVECGISFKEIVRKLAENGISLSQIKALCVSHQHKDHSLALPEFQALGIEVYYPAGETNPTAFSKPHRLTSWLQVRSFLCYHDVPCFGFVFLAENKESVLFMTDTKYFDSPLYNFRFNYIMIECNHIRKQLEAIMDKAILDGNEGKVFKFKRQASFHLSLAGVKKVLKQMDLSETKAIFLMHLSKDCCNDDKIKKEVAACFQKPTFVCYRNGGID